MKLGFLKAAMLSSLIFSATAARANDQCQILDAAHTNDYEALTFFLKKGDFDWSGEASCGIKNDVELGCKVFRGDVDAQTTHMMLAQGLTVNRYCSVWKAGRETLATSPLKTAVLSYNFDAARVLISKGADVNKLFRKLYISEYLALSGCDSGAKEREAAEGIKLLIENGASSAHISKTYERALERKCSILRAKLKPYLK